MTETTPAAPTGCTHFKLRQLARRVSQRYDAELAACGLKTTQFSLLSNVLRLGPVRPVDLARAMTMDASTLTRNLKPMVDAGWLAVGPGADARSRLVTITAAGRAKRAEAQRHWRVAQTTLNEALGIPHVAALHALIDESLARLSIPMEGESDD
jgi:DNA-binding MarR family transcriptional regulator